MGHIMNWFLVTLRGQNPSCVEAGKIKVSWTVIAKSGLMAYAYGLCAYGHVALKILVRVSLAFAFAGQWQLEK